MSNPRREMGVAIAAAVVAGALALSSAGQTWAVVTAVRTPPLPPVRDQLPGGQAAPLVTAMGLVILAAAVALVAVRGAARVAVGLLMAAAGGALGWSGVRALAGGLDADSAALSSVAGSPGVRLSSEVSVAWPVLAVVAGVVGVLAGLLVVLRGRGWPAMGRRYERPGAEPALGRRPATVEDHATAAWRALDRGEDPTEDPTEDPIGDPTEDRPDRRRDAAPGNGAS